MNVKKNVANGILLAFGLIFLLAYPWMKHPLGAFIAHISGAAVIGGLADWYAVTALFDKPLGFPYKTEVIPRSRERIIEMAGAMVERELLTPNNIYKGIKDQQPMAKLVEYLLSDEGKEAVRQLSEDILSKPMMEADLSDLWSNLMGRTREGVRDWNLSPYIVILLRRCGDADSFALLWAHLHKIVDLILRSDELKAPLRHLIEDALERYEQNREGRKILHTLAGNFLHNNELTRVLQQSLVLYWQDHSDVNSFMAVRTKTYIFQCAARLETDERWQNKVELLKNSIVDHFVVAYKEKRIKGIQANFFSVNSGMKTFIEGIYMYLADLQNDIEARRLPERTILFYLSTLMSSVSSFAGKMAMEVLCKYSAKELSNTLSEHVQGDLQMIRINGTLVGAVLGGIFYGLTALVKGGGGF